MYHRNPLWRPFRQALLERIPEPERAWLLDRASLTRRLQAISDGQFRVRVFGQRRARPQPDETRLLDMGWGESGLIREVHLLCRGQERVFARTVIPVGTLTGPERRLAHLGSRPLGAVLFADPTLQRSQLELARIETGCDLFAKATQYLPEPVGTIWGRRTVFRLADKPLLVSEIFLPGIGALPGKHSNTEAEQRDAA